MCPLSLSFLSLVTELMGKKWQNIILRTQFALGVNPSRVSPKISKKNGKTILRTQFALGVPKYVVGSFFDILGETLLGYFRVIVGSKTTIWVLYFCLKKSANYWVKHKNCFAKKNKWGKMRGTIFFEQTPWIIYIIFSLSISSNAETTTKGIL